jgi:DNA-binding transcriptional LysR family regulator
MQLELLETFRVVAQRGSITAAAQALGYTQSALSRQLAGLEAEIGTPLFDRIPRGVALTEEGLSFLAHAEAVLARLATARRELDALRGVAGGRVRVGAFPTAVAALVPRALASFRQEHPDVTLALVEGRTPQLLERLISGDADVVVVSAPPDEPIDSARFNLSHLLDEELLVAVPRDHKLARCRFVHLADLAQDPFIVGSTTAEQALMRATFPPSFQPVVDIVSSDWTGKLGCVAAGLGVALIPALAIRSAPHDIALLRTYPEDASKRRIFAATPGGRSRSHAVANFIHQLSDIAKAI